VVTKFWGSPCSVVQVERTSLRKRPESGVCNPCARKPKESTTPMHASSTFRFNRKPYTLKESPFFSLYFVPGPGVPGLWPSINSYRRAYLILLMGVNRNSSYSCLSRTWIVRTYDNLTLSVASVWMLCSRLGASKPSHSFRREVIDFRIPMDSDKAHTVYWPFGSGCTATLRKAAIHQLPFSFGHHLLQSYPQCTVFLCFQTGWQSNEQNTTMTGARLYHEYQPDTMRVVACAVWRSPDELEMTWQYVESAFRDTVVFRFQGDRVAIERRVMSIRANWRCRRLAVDLLNAETRIKTEPESVQFLPSAAGNW